MPKLTDDQTQHLFDIIDAFSNAIEPKYRKGAKEHGGNLWDKSQLELLDEALQETVDQFTYLYTLREKLTTKLPRPNVNETVRTY